MNKEKFILIEEFPPGLRNKIEAYTKQATDLVEEQKEKEKEEAIKKTVQLVLEIAYSVALLACIEDLQSRLTRDAETASRRDCRD